MRNSRIICILAALTALFGAACTPEYTQHAPYSKVEGINDTWKLTSVSIEGDIAPGSTKRTDVSSLFIGTTPMEITFNSADRSFAVNPGTTFNYFGTSGTWAFDDEVYPTKVILNAATGEKQMPLGRSIRPIDNTLEFKLGGGCSASAKYVYVYTFARQ